LSLTITFSSSSFFLSLLSLFPLSGGYTKTQQLQGMRATRVFKPPCSVLTRYSYDSGPNRNNEACALIYFVPSEPGVSMIFAKFFTKRKNMENDSGEGEARDAWREDAGGAAGSSKKKEKAPAFSRPMRGGSLFSRLLSSLISKVLDSSVAHVLGQSLADQDVLIMHGIYKRMMALAAASSSSSNSGFSGSSSSSSSLGETSSSSSSSASSSSSRWKSSYWLATQADTGVRAFHDWVERHGGGGPWGRDLGAGLLSSSSSSSLKPLPKEELLDHWERHTKHCSTCLAALKRLRKVQKIVAVVGAIVGAAAAAAGVVAAALVVSSSSSSSSSSGSVAAASVSSASPELLTLASLAQVGLPCAVSALLLALTWTSLSAWERRFYRADKLADEK